MRDALVLQALNDQVGRTARGFRHDHETRPPARQPEQGVRSARPAALRTPWRDARMPTATPVSFGIRSDTEIWVPVAALQQLLGEVAAEAAVGAGDEGDRTSDLHGDTSW